MNTNEDKSRIVFLFVFIRVHPWPVFFRFFFLRGR